MSARLAAGLRAAVLSALVAVAAAGPVFAQPPDMKVMPADGFAGGWNRSAPPKTFTKADLYGHINGGAELFLELGFEQLTIQRYRNGVDELAVEVYRMTDATSARAVYLSRRGKETPDPAFKARHTVSRHQLQMQRDRYYVIANNLSGGAAVMPSLVKAAAATAALMPSDGAIPALALLPTPGLVAGSERLIRGPVTLQAVFTLGDDDVLSLGGAVTAVAADYTSATGTHTRILADYASPAAATAAFTFLAGHLDSYLKPVSTGATRLVFQDFEKKFGVVTVTGKRLDIRVKLAKPPA